MEVFKGLPISSGLAVGEVVFLGAQAQSAHAAGTAEEERARFEAAQRAAVDALGALYEKAKRELGEKEAEVFSVHQLMAEDEDFTDLVYEAIDGGAEASEAVRQAGETCAQMFASMDDDYMRERANDVRDVAGRIARILCGDKDAALTKPCIVAAQELTPSQTVQFERRYVLGFLTERGAANSHTGILARTLGVPAVSQLHDLAALAGQTVIVDGTDGTLTACPDAQTLARANEAVQAQNEEKARRRALIGQPSVTQDGRKVDLYANIGGPDDLPLLQENDAEGVGLLRSEFLYLGRETYPSEDELFESYRKIVQAMDGRELIIRTLDIGADKKVDYFGLPPEENPALGLRAIRLCLTRPELFRTQLRAILRAAEGANVGVMFPMVTGPDELHRLKAALQEAEESLRRDGAPYGACRVGVMIETPAAVFLSRELAKECDFFSIGTNDLTQYLLAMDRQNPDLAPFCDTHHPAVLRAIETVVRSAHQENCRVGICGELAADETLTEFFLRAGVDELSVAPGRILPLRAHIRALTLA